MSGALTVLCWIDLAEASQQSVWAWADPFEVKDNRDCKTHEFRRRVSIRRGSDINLCCWAENKNFLDVLV